MALLHCLWLAREEWDLSLHALSVDHGLRPEAESEVEVVRAFCGTLNLSFSSISLGLRLESNIHAQARAARYERMWREAVAQLGPDCFLATAHHRDDRAETVLMRILRGTSLAGLGVLPARRDRLLRPIISASRSDVELHVRRHQVPHVMDPSNGDPKFLRSRVRAELIPLLRELGPGVIDHLAALAEEAHSLPEPLGLNREHRAQIRKAALDPHLPIDLRLPGGLRLVRMDED